MKRKSTEVSPVTSLDLLKDLPHVMPKLVDLVMNEWVPTPIQQEQLLAHLVECLSCQIVLRNWVETELDYDRSNGLSDEQGHRLLTQMTEIIHATKIRDDIGAYIEIFDVQGVEEANKEFPLLAEHLKVCKACQCDVSGTLDLLKRAEQARLIAPLEVNTSE